MTEVIGPTALARQLGVSRQRAEQILNPHKHRARQAVRDALARGDLIRSPACQSCETVGPLVAHHPDYEKPLDILWLCNVCHALAHADQRRVTLNQHRTPRSKAKMPVVPPQPPRRPLSDILDGMKTLPEVLDGWRLEAKLTPAEAARRCSVSRQQWYEIVSGNTRDPKGSMLRRLSQGSGIPIDALHDAVEAGLLEAVG